MVRIAVLLKRFSTVDYALALVTLGGLAMRLVAPLTTQGLPFFDSLGYYESVVTMQNQHVNPWLNYQTRQFTDELPLENFVLYLVSSYTGIDAFTVSKFLPPLLLSTIMIPGIALITAKLSGRRDIGLVGALLFAISDVGSLRESYALAEGVAIGVATIYVVCLIRALEERSASWMLLCGILLLGIFSAHNLTPYMFFMITVSVSIFMIKNGMVKPAYSLAALTTVAALFTTFTPLHYNIDHNPYERYSLLVKQIFLHQRTIASGEQFSNPLSSYVPSQPITYFLFLHIITVLTLVLALPFFVLYLVRRPRSISIALVEVWLILAGATFIVGLTGDSLFGSDNPFFGYRTWIYLMMPASAAAACTLMWLLKASPKKRLLFFALVTIALVTSVPATVSFIRQTNSQYELLNAHDYEMSVWLIQHVKGGNYTVYSTGSFHDVGDSPLVSRSDKSYFFGNFSAIFSNQTYYVALSYNTIRYPYHSQSLVVPADRFYNPYFDRVYAAQSDWIFVYNPAIDPGQVPLVNQSG